MENRRTYRLERRIGSGGMAHVFEAIAQSPGGFERRVAVKRMLPDLSADPRVRRLFEDEAKIASHLHHGGIVQVIDYGFADHDAFLVLEFVDGIDARNACRRNAGAGRPMPLPVACHVVSEVAHALAYVHEAAAPDGVPLGIVHRDVSPANLLLSWEGDVKLSDFGIAKATVRVAEQTESGQVRGKLSFMAPEQLRGEAATGKVDVYALGVTFSALLNGGAPPLRGAEALDRHRERTSFPVGGAVPPELVSLIKRCTDLDATARPTAVELAALVDRVAAAQPGPHGRRALKAWLSALQTDSPRPSKLDQLVDLVLVSGPQEGDVIVTTPARPRAASRDRPRTAPTTAPTTAPSPPLPTTHDHEAQRGSTHEWGTVPSTAPLVSPPQSEPRSPHRRGGIVWGALAVLGVVVTALASGAWLASPRPSASDERPDRRLDAGPNEAGTLPVASTVSPDATDAASDAPIEATSDAGSAPPATPPSAQRGRGSARPHRVLEPEPRTPTPTHETGWLRIGGDAVFGRSVFVDGARRGQAPLLLELPVGSHRIRVVSDTGTEILAQSVRIDASHRRSAAARMGR
ncbi:MAG: protein kinase [Sandaracinaceae bacterium]